MGFMETGALSLSLSEPLCSYKGHLIKALRGSVAQCVWARPPLVDALTQQKIVGSLRTQKNHHKKPRVFDQSALQ